MPQAAGGRPLRLSGGAAGVLGRYPCRRIGSGGAGAHPGGLADVACQAWLIGFARWQVRPAFFSAAWG
jgi:hypothetical protein